MSNHSTVQAVGDGGRHVDVDLLVPVRRDRQVEDGRRMGDLHPFADATDDRNVGLEDVRGALLDQPPEVPTRRMDLTGGDRHVDRGRDRRVTA